MKRINIKTKSILFFLLSLTPMVYFISAIINNKQLYAIKDLIMLIIFIILLFQSYPKFLYKFVVVFILINIYAIFISYEDILFYILSVREFLFYPIVGILLGYYFAKYNSFEKYFYKFLLIAFILTIIYLAIFPFDSFSSTMRLKSFWDREHEPAIVAGVTFIWTLYSNYSKKFKYITILLSIIVMLLSASRSALLGVFLVTFLINLRELKIRKIFLIFVILSIGFTFFSKLSLSNRRIDHNLGERTSQYELALENLEKNNLLGLGTDKYGVVGTIHKRYCYNGHCTTTMDSTLIKYSVNYGILFIIFFILFLFLIFILYINIKNDFDKKIFSTLIFALVLGAITGKLGAYPLNIIFYMVFGLFIYRLNYINLIRKRKNEKNTISSK